MVLGKKVAIFDWEWGQNSAVEKGRKYPGQIQYTEYRLLSDTNPQFGI